MLYPRVLITGANGLLGQALVARMSPLPNYDVLATARDERLRLSARGVSCGYAPLDVTDADAVDALFEDFAPSVVINCAAMTQVDDCETDRERCRRVNADAVETLADACRRTGARLLQLSTDFVFDGSEGPYDEDDRPAPVNYYGEAKLAGENAARRAGVDRWAVARTVLVYGTAEGEARSNILLWLLEELQAGRRVQVVTDQIRTPTYVVDLAAGVEKMVRHDATGLYHLAGRELVSVYEFAQTVADVYGLDASLIEPTDRTEFTQTAERPLVTGLVTLKAETEVSYRPRDLPDALRHLAPRLPVADV
jgi:dTDP-4-dehydrorhamnose reductase